MTDVQLALAFIEANILLALVFFAAMSKSGIIVRVGMADARLSVDAFPLMRVETSRQAGDWKFKPIKGVPETMIERVLSANRAWKLVYRSLTVNGDYDLIMCRWEPDTQA